MNNSTINNLFYYKFTNNGRLINDLLTKFKRCNWEDSFTQFVNNTGDSTDDTLLLQYLLSGFYYQNTSITELANKPILIAKQIHLTYLNTLDDLWKKNTNKQDYLNGFVLIKLVDPTTQKEKIILIDVNTILYAKNTVVQTGGDTSDPNTIYQQMNDQRDQLKNVSQSVVKSGDIRSRISADFFIVFQSD